MVETFSREQVSSCSCVCILHSSSQHGHGEADCLNCPVHLYQNQEGQTGCIPCPANSETTGEASQAASDCLCSPGYESSDGGISGHADANTCNSCHKMDFKTGLGPGACGPCQGASHSGTAWAKCRCNHGECNRSHGNRYSCTPPILFVPLFPPPPLMNHSINIVASCHA
jgi:hypothetical protein